MNATRIARLMGIALIVLPSINSNDLRKEHVRLRLATQSGAPAQVRLVTRGLIAITPKLTTGHQPWQVIATLSVPTEVALAGVGEADIASVDSAVVLVVDAQEVRANPPPARRIIGSAIRISRSSYTETFRLTPLTGVASH